MTERDDEGLAGVLSIALTTSMSLAMGLMTKMVEKGDLAPEEVREICSSTAQTLEKYLGPIADGENQTMQSLRDHAKTLKEFALIVTPGT